MTKPAAIDTTPSNSRFVRRRPHWGPSRKRRDKASSGLGPGGGDSGSAMAVINLWEAGRRLQARREAACSLPTLPRPTPRPASSRVRRLLAGGGRRGLGGLLGLLERLGGLLGGVEAI